MKIALTGSTGMIGSAVREALEAEGHSVLRLVRPGSRAAGVAWDPASGAIDLPALEGIDAAVHLAGETIAALWTPAKKRRIVQSREQGTRLLASTLAKLTRPPSVLICASAIGYYGDRPPDQAVDESARRGAGFLADVVEKWERAAEPARAAGIRVANMRFGIVLSADGGALEPLLRIYRLGLGGRLGSGRQVWSWVALEDVVGSILFALRTPSLDGPVNVVAPQPVTNLAFTRTLGRVLHRPTLFGVPALVLKTVAGDMAEEMLLFGVRVVPRKLKEAGYVFRYPELEVALRHTLRMLPASKDL